jgi:hypothetical protein
MVELTQTGVKPVFAPPLVPVERSIDFEHLSRMTLGDLALEQEVLGLFVRQAEMLRARMETDCAGLIGAAAHTLKGSATGIGAWPIARASADVETAAESGDHRAIKRAIRSLTEAITYTSAEISDTLRAAN